jgi:hypothetical protein
MAQLRLGTSAATFSSSIAALRRRHRPGRAECVRQVALTLLASGARRRTLLQLQAD